MTSSNGYDCCRSNANASVGGYRTGRQMTAEPTDAHYQLSIRLDCYHVPSGRLIVDQTMATLDLVDEQLLIWNAHLADLLSRLAMEIHVLPAPFEDTNDDIPD